MIRYYTNRELAQKLEVNLARWKRWSRSFLPPDPLGGMQSGYARQYLFKDLFKVFFGGYLLAHLKLSVTDSRKVLDEVTSWLGSNGFFDWDFSGKNKKDSESFSNDVWLYFCPLASPGSDSQTDFRYLIRKVIDVQPRGSVGNRQTVVTYGEEFIPEKDFSASSVLRHPDMHGLNMSALYDTVVAKLTQ
ncbi:hypothetical protein DSCW_10560 [Desulfosarcina widdelii]|uniref:HTH merR-type domain-containing protein n=1 Tax=Desulfosarcina widdelii TaxID=947919 RepID=A0A5K7Z061_9BACT|nr:hypothetical protein [Desulfosarcina widdelii]BBO73639.1 hypothetical protein DSCW_10560 [Desulfosarcina widdelii]